MKTTRNMMMSLVLTGSMVLGASFASAQSMSSGRQRPTTSQSSQSSAPRSASNSRSNAAQSSVQSAQQRQSSATTSPQQRSSTVNSRRPDAPATGTRSGSSSQSQVTTRSSSARQSTVTARPGSGTTTSRPSTVTARPGADRTTPGASTSGNGNRGNDNKGNGTVRPGTAPASGSVTNGSVRNSRPSTTTRTDMDSNRPGGNGNNGGYSGNGGNDKGKKGNDNGYGNDRNRGGDRAGHGNGGKRPPRANPNDNPYREQFSHNHSHGSWRSRPLPPPERPYRPAPIRYYRPVVPAHYRPYAGAPVIDRILGISFGSFFDVSLNYLYTNGYYIDGYSNDVVYLRDVRMLNLMWPDVMLCYDDFGRLANAQFVISSGYADRSRYNRLYHDLCAVYGPPISVDAIGATWFGGNTTGYVTLTADYSGARFYTTLSVGY